LNAKPKKLMGAPHTIIVTASGIRAADVCRSLKSGLPKQGVEKPSVAKLFAKHMKVAEQVAFLKKEKYVGRLLIFFMDTDILQDWVRRGNT
jgi:protein CMS1